MKFRSILKSAAIGAGVCIFMVGLALAQTAPPPAAPQAAPAPAASTPVANPERKAMREACRAKVDANLRGSEHRDAMRKCLDEARQNAREARRALQDSRKEIRKSCREELKNQRFTEDERRTAIQECVAKKDPKFGKILACQKEAQDKKLERGTPELRGFMRECTSKP